MSAARAYRVGLTGGLASGKSTVGAWLREAGFEVVDADQLVAELHRPGGPGAAAARALFGEAVLTPAGGVDHAALAARLFSDPPARTAFEREIHPLVRRRFEEIAAGPAADDEPGSPPPQPAEAPEPPAPRPEDPRHPPGAERREPEDDDPLEPPPPARREPDGDPSGPRQPERQDPEDPARPGHPREAAAMTAPGAARRVVVLEATLLAEAGYAPGFDLIVTVEAPAEAQLSRAVARGLAEPAARARLAAQGDGARRRQVAHRLIGNSGDLTELRRQVDALISDVRAAAAAAAPLAAAAPSAAAPPAATASAAEPPPAAVPSGAASSAAAPSPAAAPAAVAASLAVASPAAVPSAAASSAAVPSAAAPSAAASSAAAPSAAAPSAAAAPATEPTAVCQAPDSASGQPPAGARFPAASAAQHPAAAAAHRPPAAPSAPVASTGPTRP